MGALKPLELPNDPDEVDQEEEEVKQEEGSVVEEQADDEHVIKDVVPDQINSNAQQPEASTANPLVAAEDQIELDEIAEDIFSNFGLALQMIKDFKEGLLVPEISLTEE